MYVIPHYRQASLPNCDLPAVQMNYEASEDSIIIYMYLTCMDMYIFTRNQKKERLPDPALGH